MSELVLSSELMLLLELVLIIELLFELKLVLMLVSELNLELVFVFLFGSMNTTRKHYTHITHSLTHSLTALTLPHEPSTSNSLKHRMLINTTQNKQTYRTKTK